MKRSQPGRRARDGVVVLPGTHSKWVQGHGWPSAEFRPFTTGEMNALLRDHSSIGSGQRRAGTLRTRLPLILCQLCAGGVVSWLHDLLCIACIGRYRVRKAARNQHGAGWLAADVNSQRRQRCIRCSPDHADRQRRLGMNALPQRSACSATQKMPIRPPQPGFGRCGARLR